jgi:hypothetical protein
LYPPPWEILGFAAAPRPRPAHPPYPITSSPQPAKANRQAHKATKLIPQLPKQAQATNKTPAPLTNQKANKPKSAYTKKIDKIQSPVSLIKTTLQQNQTNVKKKNYRSFTSNSFPRQTPTNKKKPIKASKRYIPNIQAINQNPRKKIPTNVIAS